VTEDTPVSLASDGVVDQRGVAQSRKPTCTPRSVGSMRSRFTLRAVSSE
jgi:hypothetical protein